MKKILLRGILLLWVGFLSAQAPDTLWTRTYGGIGVDEGRCVRQTSDGGYIITGRTGSFGNEGCNIYVVKTNINGDTIWTNVYGGDGCDQSFSVTETSDSGYIVSGRSREYGSDQYDLFLIKLNSSGDSLWSKRYGGSESNENGLAIKKTSNGEYVCVGYTVGISFWDVYLIKIYPNGDTLWTKRYEGDDGTGFSIQETFDSGYIITGSLLNDIYLIKTNINGDTIWTRRFHRGEVDEGRSVVQTSDGGYIIAGASKITNNLDFDVWIIKTDNNGDTLWTRTFGRAGVWDKGMSVQQTSDDGYIIAGYGRPWFSDSAFVYLIRLNANGDSIWTKFVGGDLDDYGLSIIPSSDGGYVITGWTYSFGAGIDDVYLIKTKPDIGVEEEINDNLNNLSIPGLVYGNLLRLSGINKRTDVKIFNVLGREIIDQEVSPQKSYIRLNNLSAGIYFVSIEETEKRKLSKFVLIR